MTLFRAQKLIDLACSTTHDEEARTAALAACRLIRKLGLSLSEGPPSADRRGQRREPAQPRQPEPARAKPPNGGTWQRASRSGRCEGCGDFIRAGEEVYVTLGTTWCSLH
jgi:hypothetical protein